MESKVLRSDARRNLESILRAAAEVFAEGGLEVGVAEVARRAGVGTATIFRRFPTKDDLVAAVFQMRLDEIVELARECAALPGGIAAIHRFFEVATEFQIRDRGFMENVGKRRFADDPRFDSMRDEVFAAIEEMVRKAQAAGELRDDVSAADVPVLLHSVCSGAVFLTGRSAGDAAGSQPELWRRYMEIVVDGLRPRDGAELPCKAPTFDDLAAIED
jgi:AcrR family transcriptional regulator